MTRQPVIKPCAEQIVWDAHAGVFPSASVDLSLLEEWRVSGVNYVSINVGFDVMDWQQTLATLAAYRRWLYDHTDRFAVVGSIAEIERAKQSGRLAVSFDIEGMNALNGDINMLGVYHTLGVRQMLFAYNLNNAAAGGCHDDDAGLSEFGRAIVEEMNRLGIIVDCSHAGHKTSMEVIDRSSQPVVFSHSNPTAIWSHQRNIDDDQITRCARTGGVVGINGMGIFLGDNVDDNQALMRHIRHVSDLVGADHVGIGLDYSPKLEIDVGTILQSRPDFWPNGQQYDTPGIKHAGPAQLPALAELLAGDGFGDDDICGILGGNFRRVAEKVWAAGQ